MGQISLGIKKLPKFDIIDLRLLFHRYIFVPRKCPRKTPFKAQWFPWMEQSQLIYQDRGRRDCPLYSTVSYGPGREMERKSGVILYQLCITIFIISSVFILMAMVIGIFIGFIAQYRRLYLSRNSCLPISEEKAEKRRTSFMEVPQNEPLEEVQIIKLPKSKEVLRRQNTITTVELV